MRSWKALLLTAILMFVLAVTAAAQDPKMDAKLTNFKTLYERELKDAGVVGSSFTFIRGNKVLAHYNFGSANLAKNQAVDDNTIYHWASNTKPFTGIAIMQLRDRGLLKLDDPVTKYLPELRAVHNSFGSMDEITIRELMIDSSGISVGPPLTHLRGVLGGIPVETDLVERPQRKTRRVNDD